MHFYNMELISILRLQINTAKINLHFLSSLMKLQEYFSVPIHETFRLKIKLNCTASSSHKCCLTQKSTFHVILVDNHSFYKHRPKYQWLAQQTKDNIRPTIFVTTCNSSSAIQQLRLERPIPGKDLTDSYDVLNIYYSTVSILFRLSIKLMQS